MRPPERSTRERASLKSHAAARNGPDDSAAVEVARHCSKRIVGDAGHIGVHD
jgi:hypothetical protein